LHATFECQIADHATGLKRLVPYSHGHRILRDAPAAVGKALELAPWLEALAEKVATLKN
jgi:hypothetical protein